MENSSLAHAEESREDVIEEYKPPNEFVRTLGGLVPLLCLGIGLLAGWTTWNNLWAALGIMILGAVVGLLVVGFFFRSTNLGDTGVLTIIVVGLLSLIILLKILKIRVEEYRLQKEQEGKASLSLGKEFTV